MTQRKFRAASRPDGELASLEQRVEAELARWSPAFDPPMPSVASVSRARGAMLATARRRAWKLRLQWSMSAAAAVLLALVLSLPGGAPHSALPEAWPPSADPAIVLEEWSDALEESGDRLAGVVDPTLNATLDADRDAAADDALDALSESLDALSALLDV